MAQKKIPQRVENEIKLYIQDLKEEKLPINKVILFGSYAKGSQRKDSDIDLCVISPKFKDAFDAMQYLILKRKRNKTPVISPVGFSPKDMRDKYSSIIGEIKEHGIEIKI